MSEINHPQAHFRFPPEIDIEKEMRHAIEKKKMPRFLFKYMTIKGAMRFLENAELLYSRPSDFNDPFDCKSYVDINGTMRKDWYKLFSKQPPMFPGALEYFVDRAMIDPDYAQQIVQNSLEHAKESTGILCLTTKNDNILMWSHYSDCHKGVCIKFDMSRDSRSFYFPKRVVYGDKYMSFNFVENPNLFTESLFHKSQDWKYEDEYRVVKTEGYGLHTINKECVASIIFGCKTNQEDENEIRKKIEENHFNVQFQRAVQSEQSYRLNIVDIE